MSNATVKSCTGDIENGPEIDPTNENIDLCLKILILWKRSHDWSKSWVRKKWIESGSCKPVRELISRSSISVQCCQVWWFITNSVISENQLVTKFLCKSLVIFWWFLKLGKIWGNSSFLCYKISDFLTKVFGNFLQPI